MLTIIKVFVILFLLCRMEWGTPRHFLKQISTLSFQLSVQVCSLLSQSEGHGDECLFWRVQEGGTL